jgi:hypothetical protein
MPSIRIKGQVYSTLDATSTNVDTLCLRGELLGADPNTHSHTNVQHRSSLPLLPRGLLEVPSPSLHASGRPRSASGRVYTHCINTSTRRNSLYSQPPPNPLSNTKSTPPPNANNATTSQEREDDLSDVRVPSHVIARSLINSADDEDSQISGHHHDDVVEHLDVIGISPSSLVLHSITMYFRFTSWRRFKSHQCRKFHLDVSLPLMIYFSNIL